MQSDDEPGPSNPQTQEPHVKRRRLHGACDICRRKKIKCNSAEMPNKICSNCIAYNLECTHDIPRHASKKETEKGYIQSLEERLDKMEQLLRSVRPELDIEQSVASANSPESVHSAHTPPSLGGYSRSTPVTDIPYPTPQTLPDTAAFLASPTVGTQDLSEEEDLAHIKLSKQLSRLHVDTIEDRFFGKSSAFMLMAHAKNIKHETTGVDAVPGKNLRRPFFWDLRAWEVEHVNSDLPQFEFPEKDLLDSLVNLYFERLNIYVPLLHRPTFERDLANDLHLHDTGFAQVILMVCALASRCSDDPRVILPNDKTGLSSGFKFFRQTRLMRNKLLDKISLYDLQYFCLVIPYLLASSLPQAGWSLVALGLRFAQERGAHRRRGDQKPNIVNELWKRCFWALITYDRLTSSFVGRTCAMPDEDFDADLPLDVDDEYWECEDPEQNWKQPPGKPSKVAAFNAHIRLCEILAFTLRTLYSTKKSKLLTGLIGDQWEERVVTELDSSMNKWKDSLPEHLRWDPNRPDHLFLHQSAFIHATFYYLQIQIHRPFIQKPTSLSFPSLAICTHAARSCSHLVDAKGPGWIYPYPNIFIAAFASGIVLLLHMYGGRRAGLNTDLEKETKDIDRCMLALRAMEKRQVVSPCPKSQFSHTIGRWHVAGRLVDILTDLATLHEGQAPPPQYVSTKRPRDEKHARQSRERQPTDPTTSTSPNQSRPVKPRPNRQPKGWPPSPPSSSVLPAGSLKIEQDRSPRSRTLSDQVLGTPLASTPQTSLTFGSNPNLNSSRSSYMGPNALAMESASSTGSNSSWDLNHLVLAQMNLGTTPQPFSGGPMAQGQAFPNAYPNNFGGSNGLSTANSTPMATGFSNGDQSLPAMSPFLGHNQLLNMNQDVSQDMTALWSDAPVDFNIEDWDQFVANFNNLNGGSWAGGPQDFTNVI
ncbi:hypothetical protein NP233_g5435 [Leucocoprinus birnbaumii]|uniref:Zn(2)-C6 fungal-type domain-containing protein n=1 Tax=Leucocoprinus birnbaumii TaxID=56174 RepID=A0AAD5VSV9_9AGAR|nr:hypothetical protein NP233_g5435 [Leucocoprinus birnbaumii]